MKTNQTKIAAFLSVGALIGGLTACAHTGGSIAAEPPGLLRVHPTNPRYFTDGTKHADSSLRAVYLAGSHTWNNLIDVGPGDPPAAFDYCLAAAGKEYVVYVPGGDSVTADLNAAPGSFQAEWLDPRQRISRAGKSGAGAAKRTFQWPFDGDVVLHLKVQ